LGVNSMTGVVANEPHGYYNRQMLGRSRVKSRRNDDGSERSLLEQQQRGSAGTIRAGLSMFLLILSLFIVGGCQTETPNTPTSLAAAPTLTQAPTLIPVSEVVLNTVPATFTLEAAAEISSPTPANLPSKTPRPTNTAWPTETPTSTVTQTPAPVVVPPETPTPSPTIPAVSGVNLLPNPSFEEGWYHINGIPELQVANHWTLEWDTGENPLDPDPWNNFVRPESRLLNGDFLPESEHDLFIWDGDYTAKIFKRTGALSFRLFTNVYLEPGTYLFEINVFPDMVDDYTDGGAKIWAPDPLSAQLRFLTGDTVGNWIYPSFGERITYSHAFQINSAGQHRVGVAFLGRWAILNNGWFLDKWSLHQLAADS
jgi:hypothetical protein